MTSVAFFLWLSTEAMVESGGLPQAVAEEEKEQSS